MHVKGFSASLTLLFAILATPAGAQWPDVSPHIEQITVRAGDVILENHVRIRDGKLSNWPDPDLIELRALDVSGATGDCRVPEGFPGADNWRKPRVIACMEEHFWVARRAYCAEGGREQGSLYRVSKTDGAVREYDVVPRCHEATSLVRAGGRIWFGTIRPIEKYRARSGAGVVAFDPEDPELQTSQYLSPWTITALGTDGSTVWAAGHQGLARLEAGAGVMEKRYYRLFVAADDSLRLGLAGQPQSEQEQALYEYFLKFPITDMQGFIDEARSSEREVALWWQGGGRLEFLPWYLDALKRYSKAGDELPDFNRDYMFSRLVGLVLDIRKYHPDQVSEERLRTVFRDLWEQPHSASRKKTILEAWRELGIQPGDRHREVEFARYLESWQRRPQRRAQYKDLCTFVASNPRFGELLPEFFSRLPLPEKANGQACVQGEGAVYVKPEPEVKRSRPESERLQRAGDSVHIEKRLDELKDLRCIRSERDVQKEQLDGSQSNGGVILGATGSISCYRIKEEKKNRQPVDSEESSGARQ